MNTPSPYGALLFATSLALIPILISLTTSYVKISVVLGLLRSGLGTQQVPSGIVVMALALTLTLMTMSPTINTSFQQMQSTEFEKLFSSPRIPSLEKLKPFLAPWQAFLERHAGTKEREVLEGLMPEEQTQSFSVLLTAFLLSELKQGFVMGFILLLPFLLIDLIVANILAGMGMYMLSPTMISLPLKLMLFVMADGWLLLAKGLIASYQPYV